MSANVCVFWLRCIEIDNTLIKINVPLPHPFASLISNFPFFLFVFNLCLSFSLSVNLSVINQAKSCSREIDRDQIDDRVRALRSDWSGVVAGVSVTGPGRVRWSIREPSTVSSTGSSTSVPPLPPPPSGPGPTPFYRRSPQVHRKCTFSVPRTCCPLARLSRISDISINLYSRTNYHGHYLYLTHRTNYLYL